MKIGLVLDDTLDTPDGVQQYVTGLGQWLSEQGHEVHYIVGSTMRTDLANIHSLSRNLRVKFNGNRMSMPLPVSGRKLRAFLAGHQFDILHVQVPYSPFLAGRLISLSPATTTVVGTFHILPYRRLERFANRLLAFLNARSGRRFQAMIAASPAAAEFAKACYGYSASVIPHPFSYKDFAITPTPTNGMVYIVYMARLVERKGALWLLKAVARLRQQQTLPANVRVLIGGKGPLQAQLEAYVDAESLADIVSFKGFIDGPARARFLAQADIGVFPSTAGESFGISIIEALAAVRGVVLAGDNPGYRAAMQLPDQLLDPADTALFAASLGKWLDDAPGRRAAHDRQRSIARHYDRDIVCAKVLDIYRQALQKAAQS